MFIYYKMYLKYFSYLISLAGFVYTILDLKKGF